MSFVVAKGYLRLIRFEVGRRFIFSRILTLIILRKKKRDKKNKSWLWANACLLAGIRAC
jgi:hypothetical protein